MRENPYESTGSDLLVNATQETDSLASGMGPLFRNPAGRAFSVVVCASPILCYALEVMFFLGVSASQGRMVQPGMPDPSSVLGGLPAAALVLLLLASMASLPIAIAISWGTGEWFRHFGGYLAALFLSAWLHHMDFFQLSTWLAD